MIPVKNKLLHYLRNNEDVHIYLRRLHTTVWVIGIVIGVVLTLLVEHCL